ncbi:hypothetical protein D9758_017146 [Tetrapyrgos nigripes]|uniref:Uncharacterized protein n=1 Tax=Tetrapyrgos nigripes TaxID=182062 RepID=A0A8H5BVG9_9AGAR|nr:hypothetical protein D9758_017146 [Tetrapyrgos nigripes]
MDNLIAGLQSRQPVAPLFNLTAASLVFSTITFIISMLHLGTDSIWVIPVVFGLTVLYHTTILVFEYRRSLETVIIINPQERPISSTSSTITSLLCASCLVAMWLGAAGLTAVIAVFVGKDLQLGSEVGETVNGKGKNGVLGLTIAQLVLCVLEALLMLGIVSRSAYERKFGGPENWKRYNFRY